MPNSSKLKSNAAVKAKRTETIRASQAKRRKQLKTITVEIDSSTHSKIKELADNKHTTMQKLVSGAIKSITLPIANDRPWSVFGEELHPEEDCEFTHVSLFSGCGGFDLGFRQAGFKTVFANDIDPDACKTYKLNLGEIAEGDIRAIRLPKLKRRLDVLTAGFPCQPFSNAGSRKGINDDRGTLFQTAIDIVKELTPKVVVFENVRGLLSFKKGKKLLIEDICSQLDKLGYNVVFSLIDASHHNVPQKRLRVIIVGVTKSIKHNIFSFPKPVIRDDLTLRHTILDVPIDAPNQNDILTLSPQAAKLNIMVPEGGSWKDIAYNDLPLRMQKIRDNMQRYHSPNFYRRFHRDEIAGTITAAFTPENAGILHPTEKRTYSVRESARIQSFPDWFVFTGKHLKTKYKQIGNAVPPRLAYEIALGLKNNLLGIKHSEVSESISFKQFISAGKPLRACDRDVIFSPEQNKGSGKNR